jgi:hypothetical protein
MKEFPVFIKVKESKSTSRKQRRKSAEATNSLSIFLQKM